MNQDGRFLTRQQLVYELRSTLERVGMNQARYFGHRFRIGAATMAARNGMKDS